MINTSLKQGSKSFYLASQFLPRHYREDASYLYQVCRYIDDLVDKAAERGEEAEHVRIQLDEVLESPEVQAFFTSRHIPFRYLEELIQGVLMDLSVSRYKTYIELQRYCYLVAGTVGGMLTHLFGVTDEKALHQAESLGVAMQITNILRDVEEDVSLGHIYLAQEDLEYFGVSENDISSKRYTLQVKALIHEYSSRAWKLYAEGNKGISALPFRVRFAIRAAWYVYSGILKKIEKNDYNPFLGRVKVPFAQKLTRIGAMYTASVLGKITR